LSGAPARSPLDTWLAARIGRQGRAELPTLAEAVMEAWQMKELRRTLAWARHASGFHARRLESASIDALHCRADMARLPRMTAADLAAPGLLVVSQDEIARVVSLPTSGTSGPPKRLHFSEADLTRTREFFAIGMRTLCGKGDAVLVLLPGRRAFGVADLLTRALPEIGAHAVLPPETWTAEELPGLVAASGVTTLIAAPSQFAQMLKLPPGAFKNRFQAVLSSAEPLDAPLRASIKNTWACDVYDHWGMTETGYGGGVECAAHSGYHLREADLLVEIADPLTGAPLPDGELGEILVTTLGERAMPLLRYRTGDAGRMLPAPCPCGSRLRRLGPVAGRRATGNPGDADITRPIKGWSRQR